MRVIAEIYCRKGETVQRWNSLSEMREALSEASKAYGPVRADVWRDMAGDEFYGLDAPTWRIIRGPGMFVRTETFGA